MNSNSEIYLLITDGPITIESAIIMKHFVISKFDSLFVSKFEVSTNRLMVV
jgi:hypothetical protein